MLCAAADHFSLYPTRSQSFRYSILQIPAVFLTRLPVTCAFAGQLCPDKMTVLVPPELLPDGAKGLVFDCDGTLMDTMSQHWESWRLACAKFGLQMTLQQFIGCVMGASE